jgi:ribosome-associated protein
MVVRRFELADLAPWIDVRFDPAQGPGGQHVNKLSTRATLLFDFLRCPALTARERTLVGERCRTRLARDGRLRVVAQRERTQARNVAAAQARLLELLQQVVRVPPPRRPTHPTAAAQQRRLQAKRNRGLTKQRRRAPPGQVE